MLRRLQVFSMKRLQFFFLWSAPRRAGSRSRLARPGSEVCVIFLFLQRWSPWFWLWVSPFELTLTLWKRRWLLWMSMTVRRSFILHAHEPTNERNRRVSSKRTNFLVVPLPDDGRITSPIQICSARDKRPVGWILDHRSRRSWATNPTSGRR